MIVVQKCDEISMIGRTEEETEPHIEIGISLKSHCVRNEEEVQTLLALYRYQLPNYAKQYQKALQLLQPHFQLRLTIAEKLLSGTEANQLIMLKKSRPGEEWIDRTKDYIHTMEEAVDYKHLDCLPDDSRLKQLAFLAGECIAQLQWQQALPHLFRIISLGNNVNTPYFYLAMVIIAASGSPAQQQLYQRSLWMERDLQVAVLEGISSWGFQITIDLQNFKSDVISLYEQCRQIMEMLSEMEKQVALLRVNGQEVDHGKQYFRPEQLKLKKKELQDMLQEVRWGDDHDLACLRPLMEAMVHNCFHNRTPNQTTDMKVSLRTYFKRQSANTLCKSLKLYKLSSHTNDHYLTEDCLNQCIRLFQAESLCPPKQHYSDFLRNILIRRQAKAAELRILLQKKPINPENPQQFNEHSLPDKPKHKAKKQSKFKKQKGEKSDEQHGLRYSQQRESGRNEGREVEQGVSESRLSGFEQRGKELAQAVGLMTFYWQNEWGQQVKTVQGTGFLITSQVVVTAKHNFYHRTQKGRCSGCTIQLTTADAPQKIITYYSKPSNQWFESQQLDVGAVFLEQPVRHFRGNIRLATRNDVLQLRDREELMVMGYSLQNRVPTKPDRVSLLSSVFMNIRQPYLEYSSNTLGGHSGSPVFARSTGRQCLVVGVHVSRKIQGNVCRAVFLSDRIATQITSWAKHKFSQQIHLPQSFQTITSNINKEMEQFREELLLVNRDCNIPDILAILRQRILDRNGDAEVFQEVSCKLLPLLQDRDIEQFYGRLYTKDGVEHARKELLRLGFQAPRQLPSYELAENRQYSLPHNFHQPMVQEEPSKIVISLKEREQTRDSDQDDVDDDEGLSQCSQEEQRQQEQQQERGQLAISKEQKIVISYQPPEHIPKDSPYLSFLRLRLKATKTTIDHLSSVESAFVGRQRVCRGGRWELGVVVERGWDDWQWVQCLKVSRGLLLVLIRDMVRMVMELQQRKIYLANLQKRNIALYCQQHVNYSTTSPEHYLDDLSRLRFKLVNFENTLCLDTEETSKPAFKMIGLGRKLAGNEYMDMEMQPIMPMLIERGRDALERRFREEYSTCLSGQISYLGNYDGARLLSTADSEHLLDLCHRHQYPQMVDFLDEAIAKMK